MKDSMKGRLPGLLILTAVMISVAGMFKGMISEGAAVSVLTLAGLLAMIRWARISLVSVKQLSLIAALTAAAALGRIPFAAIPGVQPTSFLIILTGYVFGPQAGFMTGAMSALVSNFFLGQGPWTPWQMLGWGLMGMFAGYVNRIKTGHVSWLLAVFGGLWGYFYGFIQNIGFAVLFLYPLTFKGYISSCILSAAFDSIHALTNFFLCLFFAGPVIKILTSFRQRLDYKYVQADPEDHFTAMDWPQENDNKPGS